MQLTSIHLRRMSAVRAPKQAKQLRKLFQSDRECERDHPEQARRYNRPLLHSTRNVARVALADGLYPFIVTYDDEAIGMATVIPNVKVSSDASVVRGTELDYWVTPRLNLDSVHNFIARDLIALGRGIAAHENATLDSNISMIERAALISSQFRQTSQETTVAPNDCVLAFVGDPATSANRGLAHVLQRNTDQSRFHVEGTDVFGIGPTMADAALYTGKLIGADLQVV